MVTLLAYTCLCCMCCDVRACVMRVHVYDYLYCMREGLYAGVFEQRRERERGGGRERRVGGACVLHLLSQELSVSTRPY